MILEVWQQSCAPPLPALREHLILDVDVDVAMQYVEFLSSALSSEAYSTMLPSITDLVQNYQLDIEVALQVLIPCICQCACGTYHRCLQWCMSILLVLGRHDGALVCCTLTTAFQSLPGSAPAEVVCLSRHTGQS